MIGVFKPDHFKRNAFIGLFTVIQSRFIFNNNLQACRSLELDMLITNK